MQIIIFTHICTKYIPSASIKISHTAHHITALPAVTVLPVAVAGGEVVPVPTVVLGTVPVKVVVVPVPTVPVVTVSVGPVSPTVPAEDVG